MEEHETTIRERPSRGEVEPAALQVIARHGPLILGSARRYSLSPEDAEDAYQRGLEILLTKAPTTSEAELVPWLRTVVKHEALAIRRHRQRATPTEDEALEGAAGDRAPGNITHDQAERLERLRVGAEAMGRLKPQEVRCLLLLAEGYSYKQICAETGFTYTKVNRCITEGRRSFLDRVASIESGAECERYRPLLSVLADGEASAADVAALRPHLRSCLSCRATLREYRQAPARVAALTPPVALAGSGLLARAAEWLNAWLQDRSALIGFKVQSLAELATTQPAAHKAAAVAATTAALAGGTVASVQSTDPREQRPAGREQAALVPSRESPARATGATRAPTRARRPRPAARAKRSSPKPPPVAARRVATAAAAPVARAARVHSPASTTSRAPAPAPARVSAPAPPPSPKPTPAPKPRRQAPAPDDGGEFGL